MLKHVAQLGRRLPVIAGMAALTALAFCAEPANAQQPYRPPQKTGHKIVPASLDFGKVPVNGSRTLTFTIKNVGKGHVALIGTVSPPTGKGAARFNVFPLGPFSVAPDQSQTFQVIFSPTRNGPSGPATIRITRMNSPAKTGVVHLSGRGATSTASLPANVFVTNAACNWVTVYPAGSSGNASPIVAPTNLCQPYGIALDASGNIYVASEAQSALVVYPAGSRGNVAPSAAIIGPNTGLISPSAVALDATGNIYVTNLGSVTVYSAGSNGNVAPQATIAGPHTGLNFPLGIALDSQGKIYVANFGGSVTVYPAGSNGDVTPGATIAGSNTGITQIPHGPVAGPQGIALDASGNIFVTGGLGPMGVVVFAAGANGNVAPIGGIGGSKTGLREPYGIALDASGNIYIANAGQDFVTVYPAGSNGNVAPLATITGPHTVSPNASLGTPVGLALDRAGNIYLSESANNDVIVYPAGSNGNVAPSATIEPVTGMSEPLGIAFDAAANIYVANTGNDSITVYPAGSNASVAPSATIAGPNTGLDAPTGIAIGAGGEIYAANSRADSVTAYAPSSNGDVAPIATIAGSNTGLNDPFGIALDSTGNIYVVNNLLGSNSVTVYPAGSNGSVAPSATISGFDTGLVDFTDGIAVDSTGKIYVAVAIHEGGSAIQVYAPGSTGDVSPIAAIGGDCALFEPTGVALDASGNVYVSNSSEYNLGCNPMFGGNNVLVYSPSSSGSTGPLVTIGGQATDLVGPSGIAVH